MIIITAIAKRAKTPAPHDRETHMSLWQKIGKECSRAVNIRFCFDICSVQKNGSLTVEEFRQIGQFYPLCEKFIMDGCAFIPEQNKNVMGQVEAVINSIVLSKNNLLEVAFGMPLFDCEMDHFGVTVEAFVHNMNQKLAQCTDSEFMEQVWISYDFGLHISGMPLLHFHIIKQKGAICQEEGSVIRLCGEGMDILWPTDVELQNLQRKKTEVRLVWTFFRKKEVSYYYSRFLCFVSESVLGRYIEKLVISFPPNTFIQLDGRVHKVKRGDNAVIYFEELKNGLRACTLCKTVSFIGGCRNSVAEGVTCLKKLVKCLGQNLNLFAIFLEIGVPKNGCAITGKGQKWPLKISRLPEGRNDAGFMWEEGSVQAAGGRNVLWVVKLQRKRKASALTSFARKIC